MDSLSDNTEDRFFEHAVFTPVLLNASIVTVYKYFC
jgi:hypothetical protein